MICVAWLTFFGVSINAVSFQSIGHHNSIIIRKKMTKKRAKRTPEEGERAMIAGIIEGSPDAVGVAVIRLNCGCRKMAAVDKQGEAASKIIMYRDQADSICDQCKDDNGDYMRVTEQFMAWNTPEPTNAVKQEISAKVLGTSEERPN